MNATQQEKIKKFLSDKVMYEAVKQALQESFSKPQDHSDVHVLAATTIARDLLEEGFKSLKKYYQEDRTPQRREPIGL